MKFSSLVLSGSAVISLAANDPPNSSCDENQCILSNGFVEAILSRSGGVWLTSLRGDFHGEGRYGNNLLSEGGIRFEREDVAGVVHTSAGQGPRSDVIEMFSDDCVSFSIESVYDDVISPGAVESWYLSLCDNQRSLTFTTTGKAIDAEMEAKCVRNSIYMNPISIVGFYDHGVVQMMSASPVRSYFGSSNSLQRLYVLGETGSIDIQRSFPSETESSDTVMLSVNAETINPINFRTGFQDILIGSYSTDLRDRWTSGWTAINTTVTLGQATWSTSMTLTPNNFNFPASTLPSDTIGNLDGRGDGELGAFMTGMYSNGVGNLCTFDNEVQYGFHVAQIATSLRVDNSRGYDGTYNYFDPDNFFALSAILYSGDPYLLEQARAVIERTGSFMKPETGQLPHHFNGIAPYFLALSGETQTGPNIFWVKTALQYAAASGNYSWLKNYLPTLRQASDFVFDLIETENDGGISLLYAPGSLMIDVFIRNNYTSDSNAMVVGFLNEFAQVELRFGNETRGKELQTLSSRVKESMNKYLWASVESGDDHFVTQLNKDDGSIRDFVDYDSNLIAIAHQIPSEEDSRKILKRVDQGKCSTASGAGSQFVSELYYGTEDTTGGNTGDSWCSMGRIGWFDALSRKLLGTSQDLEYVEKSILDPLVRDLNQNTWLHERYGCDGNQQENRTMFYFEYPALVSMLLKDIRYGVQLDVSGLTLNPFRSDTTVEFEYHLGNVDISYRPLSVVTVSIPADIQDSATRCFTSYVIHGLIPEASYEVKATEECQCEHKDSMKIVSTDAKGVLAFKGPAGVRPCVVSMTLL